MTNWLLLYLSTTLVVALWFQPLAASADEPGQAQEAVPPAAAQPSVTPAAQPVTSTAPAAPDNTSAGVQTGLTSPLRGPIGGPIGGPAQTTSPPQGNSTQTTTQQTTQTTSTGAAANASLHGLANITSVTATATALSNSPLPRIRDEDIQFVQIMLRNESQQVAIVNGDAAQAAVGSQTAPAAGGRYLVTSAKPGLTKEKFIIVTAAYVGSSALAGPMIYEYVTPSQHRKRSLGEAIGIDGTRHQVEAERFGVRVLMPGDESVGWMAFACEPEQAIKTVTIPLSFSRSLTPDGVLEVPVHAAPLVNVQPANTAQNANAPQTAGESAAKTAAQGAAPTPAPTPAPAPAVPPGGP